MAAVAALTTTACFTYGIREVMFAYYRSGPETALQLMDLITVQPGNQPLAARERAMAKLELGRYGQVSPALGPINSCEQSLDVHPSTIRSGTGLFLGETFERVMVPFVSLAAQLALQKDFEAAEQADRALACARRLGVGADRCPATWVLAALAYEAVGRHGAAETTLNQLLWSATSTDQASIKEVVGHLMAPDPRERSLVVVLLLGPGPFKRRGTVDLVDGKLLSWPMYEQEDEPAGFSAELYIDDLPPVRSVVVENLWQTARRDLADRYDQLLASVVPDAAGSSERVRKTLGLSDEQAARVVAAFAEEQEYLGWWSLPASIHVIRASVGDEAKWCDLVVRDSEGTVLDGEDIEVPTEWKDGTLFVVRRIP